MHWLISKRMKLDRRKQQIRLKMKMRKLARRKQQQRPNVVSGMNTEGDRKMQIDKGDYQILKALYENQFQYCFYAKYGFDDDRDILSMIKVRRNDTNKRIFRLRLRVSTTLPRCILQLDALESLFITLNGRLPRRIGQLKNLKDLTIFTNTPQALPEELGDLSNLEFLRVKADFVTIPSSLSRLPKFEKLILHISNTPNNIDEFQTLKHLEFTCRDELPLSICNLCHLEHLSLYSSTIRYLPEEICNLENLQILDLNDSHITELPRSIGKLQNLKTLDLDFTTNLATLPVEIGDLGQLENLFLRNKKFVFPEQIPSTIFNLKNLKRLHLSWAFYNANRLTNFEMLSRLVSECPRLGFIDLRENWTLVTPSLNPRLAHSLMCNRINTKLCHGDASPNSRYDRLISNFELWPFILEQFDRTFRSYPRGSPAAYFEQFENPDAMYYLIINHLPNLLEAVKKNAK